MHKLNFSCVEQNTQNHSTCVCCVQSNKYEQSMFEAVFTVRKVELLHSYIIQWINNTIVC